MTGTPRWLILKHCSGALVPSWQNITFWSASKKVKGYIPCLQVNTCSANLKCARSVSM